MEAEWEGWPATRAWSVFSHEGVLTIPKVFWPLARARGLTYESEVRAREGWPNWQYRYAFIKYVIETDRQASRETKDYKRERNKTKGEEGKKKKKLCLRAQKQKAQKKIATAWKKAREGIDETLQVKNTE